MATDEDLVLKMISVVTEYRDELHAPDGVIALMRTDSAKTRELLENHLKREEENWKMVRNELSQTRLLVEQILVATNNTNARVDNLDRELSALRRRVEALERHASG